MYQGDHYYIPHLEDRSFYQVKLQLIITDNEVTYDCQENNLGPIEVIHVVPTVPEEDDPEITLPEFTCGESFNAPVISNTTPLGAAYVEDIFFIGGFPILIKTIEGGSGIFSGNGILPVPFQNKTILVDFVGVSVNTDYQIFEGEVRGIYDDIANIPVLPNDPFYIGGDICQPQTGLVGFDQNGNWQPDNLPYNPTTGFGPEGTYDVQPPYPGYQSGDPFDPNYSPTGFDSDGNHIDTGGPFDSGGCGQLGLTADGQPCFNTPSEPYGWLDPNGDPPTAGGIVLADANAANIRDYIIQALNILSAEASDSIQSIEGVCNEIRADFDNDISGFNETEIVIGENEEYYKKGMYQNFSNTPEPLPVTDNERDGGVIQLEKRHIDLYSCDRRLHKYIYWAEVIMNFRSAGALDQCEKDLLDLMQRMSDADAAEMQADSTLLIDWVFNEVDRKVYRELEELHGELLGHQNKLKEIFQFNDLLKTPSFSPNNNPVSTAGIGFDIRDLSKTALEELQFSFLQGHKYIGNTHRAFYLQALKQHKSSTLTQANQNLLPLVVSKTVAGKEQSIYIDEIVFTPTAAKCNIYFILEPPNNGNKAVFALEDVGFGPTGFPANLTTRLKLVNDMGIRLSNATRLTFIGGDSTYVAFDCEGFAGMSVQAKIEFCRSYLLPLDPVTLEVIPEDSVLVEAHFTAAMPAWGEFIAELDFDPFALNSAPNTKFKVEGAKLDLSDKLTIAGIKFPNNYVSPFVTNNQASPQWKGFYLSELSVTLPNKFSQNSDPLTGGVRDVIIDGMGFSGRIFLTPVLPLESGSIGGWAFSIDTFQLGVVANRINYGSLDGLINVPLLKGKGSDSTSVSEVDCLVYKGIIDAGNKYSFTVYPDSIYDVPLWKAEASIFSSSRVEIQEENNQFIATAVLNGKLSLDADFSPSKSFKLDDVTFQGVQVRSHPPYLKLGSWSLPGEVGANFGGFGLTIKSPIVDDSNPDLPTISFGALLRLNDNEGEPQDSDKPSLTASGHFSISGEMVQEGNRQRWRYKQFNVHEFCIEAGGMNGVKELGGCLSFFDESQWAGSSTNWGSGFRGELSAVFDLKKLDLGVAVIAQFGKISEGEPFKYFMIDGMAVNQDGLPLGPLNLHGFGGGVAYNMNRLQSPAGVPGSPTSSPGIGTTLSGIQFTPQREGGVGIFANVAMATTSKKAFNFNATLGADFNAGGGLSFLYFKGNARFMSDLDISASCDYDPGNYQPNNGADVSAFIDLQMDFNSGIFDGAFDVFVNAANGKIIGAKDVNRKYFGGCEMSFGSPDGWYINMGRPAPSARNILQANVAGVGLDFTSYLNIGTKIDPMPSPPDKITQILGVGNFMANESRRASGNGFAFGASLELSTGQLEWWKFYASFMAEIGFDFNLQDYGTEINCLNTGEPLGINGWYASGQAYAYFIGVIGVKVGNKDFDIIELGAAAILQAKLPNPFWAKATVGGYYSILGGLINGSCQFKVELGKQCELEPGSSFVPQFAIYDNFSPANSESGFPTLGKPEITFGLPVSKNFEEDGSIFRLEVDYARIEDSAGGIIPTELVYDESGLYLSLVPFYEFPAEDSLTLHINVVVLKDGEEVDNEERVIHFTTSEALKTIPLSNIASSYPIHGQFNYYKAQNNFTAGFSRGFIQLKAGQPSLLLNEPEGQRLMVRIRKMRGEDALTNVYVNAEPNFQGNRIDFLIPQNAIENGSFYSVALVFQDTPPSTGTNNNSGLGGLAGGGLGFGNDQGGNRGMAVFVKERPYPRSMLTSYVGNVARGNLNAVPGIPANTNNFLNMGPLPEDDLLVNFNFRASQYNTFAEKLTAFFSQAEFLDRNIQLLYRATNFEPFDFYETEANEFGQSFVNISCNHYYNSHVWFDRAISDFYQHLPTSNIKLLRSEGVEKVPTWAAQVMTVGPSVIRAPDYASYLEFKDYENNIVSIFIDPFRQYQSDINDIRTQVSDWYLSYMMACSSNPDPQGGECLQYSNSVWENIIKDPWLRDLYEETINFKIPAQPGEYKAVIEFQAPGVQPFSFNKTFIKQ